MATTLFVISGPSGAGKSTASKILADAGIERMRTYTTRPQRRGEEASSYVFVDERRFDQLYNSGYFAEIVTKYAGHRYASPRSILVDDGASSMVVELDPAGYRFCREKSARRIIGIFVTTPTEDELKRRLLNRDGDRIVDEDQSRLSDWEVLRSEISDFDHVVVNDDRSTFRAELWSIVESELGREATPTTADPNPERKSEPK